MRSLQVPETVDCTAGVLGWWWGSCEDRIFCMGCSLWLMVKVASDSVCRGTLTHPCPLCFVAFLILSGSVEWPPCCLSVILLWLEPRTRARLTSALHCSLLGWRANGFTFFRGSCPVAWYFGSSAWGMLTPVDLRTGRAFGFLPWSRIPSRLHL